MPRWLNTENGWAAGASAARDGPCVSKPSSTSWVRELLCIYIKIGVWWGLLLWILCTDCSYLLSIRLFVTTFIQTCPWRRSQTARGTTLGSLGPSSGRSVCSLMPRRSSRPSSEAPSGARRSFPGPSETLSDGGWWIEEEKKWKTFCFWCGVSSRLS